MRIFRHFQDVPPGLRGSVVAVGNFDGVHLGHRALIGEAARQARAAGVPLTVLAFEPHPQEYLRTLRGEPASLESFRLTPLRTKARLIAELGADAFFALPFDAAMAGRLAPQFVQDVLVDGLGVSGVVVGEDFVFGKGRGGNLQTLQDEGARHGFGVRPMYQVTVPLMETHLFDFDGDLYGKHLSVELVDYVRPEASFSGLPALIAQIADDCQAARQILARTPRLPALNG